MSNIRQLALALILVAGTTFTVAAYMDSQLGKLRPDSEPSALILELSPSQSTHPQSTLSQASLPGGTHSHSMARPLRAANGQKRGKSATTRSRGRYQGIVCSPASAGAQRPSSGPPTVYFSIERIKPISSICEREDNPSVIPASAAKSGTF